MNTRSPNPMAPRARSAFRGLTAATTGIATFGALVGTGWYAGDAASRYEQEQADKAAAEARAAQARADWFAAHPVKRVIEKRRKHRTVVRTVHVAAAGYDVQPGRGGSITPSPSSGGGSQPSNGGGSGGGNAPAAPAPPPPPPPPPPAQSSGS